MHEHHNANGPEDGATESQLRSSGHDDDVGLWFGGWCLMEVALFKLPQYITVEVPRLFIALELPTRGYLACTDLVLALHRHHHCGYSRDRRHHCFSFQAPASSSPAGDRIPLPTPPPPPIPLVSPHISQHGILHWPATRVPRLTTSQAAQNSAGIQTLLDVCDFHVRWNHDCLSNHLPRPSVRRKRLYRKVRVTPTDE